MGCQVRSQHKQSSYCSVDTVVVHISQSVCDRMSYCAECLTDESHMKEHVEGVEFVKYQVKHGDLPWDILVQDHELKRACSHSAV